MDFLFTKNAWEDFEYWIETDLEIVAKIRALLKSQESIVANVF